MIPIYRAVVTALTGLLAHFAVQAASPLPSSFPHAYPNLPNAKGDFSDAKAWQKYFEVTNPLPNVTFLHTRSYAGNLPVNRPHHLNNTLFFWAVEHEEGSLTSRESQKPWIIWLNGGPGSSSLLGLLLENGHIHFSGDMTPIPNPFSWNTAADVVWIDQPVGVGFSTSDADAFAADEDQVGADFMGFLSNLVKVFPGLATRPLYLTGESYAGVYIPYIAKTYFSTPYPPVRIAKIAMGDGSYGSDETDIYPSVPQVMETYPQLIGYDPLVLQYFREQTHLCRFDINLTYPQHGIIPTVIPPQSDILGVPTSPPNSSRTLRFGNGRMNKARGNAILGRTLAHVKRAQQVWVREEKEHPKRHARRSAMMHERRDAWLHDRRAARRDLTGRANGTIDSFYLCDTFDEMIDYALNFSAPWAGHNLSGFDFIPDALDPEAVPSVDSVGLYLNDPRVVATIHAPTSKAWLPTFTPQSGYPFGGKMQGDPSPVPMSFFSELASNLSEHAIPWIFMSGNADALLPHFGTEVVIQNTTFGGTQGFTQRPSTPFFDSDGKFAGKVHQERNLTYALFAGAGHLIPTSKPCASLTFLKEFILGSNRLGTVLPDGTTVGGTNASLAQSILPAYTDPLFFGSGTTAGSTVAPGATVAAWDKFVSTAVLTGVPAATPNA